MDKLHRKILLFLFSIMVIGNLMSQETYRLKDGMYSVMCGTLDEVRHVAQMDSVAELFLYFYDMKPPSEIVLKNPFYLRTLSISCNHPEDVYIKDSLINLKTLEIEGNFKGILNVKYRPSMIHSFAVFNWRGGDYTFLENFTNLDTLCIGFMHNEDKLFTTLSLLKSLTYLWILKKYGEIRLGEEFSYLSSLKTIKGNIRFDDNNIDRLNSCAQLTSVIFTMVKIGKIPDSFATLTSRKRVVFGAAKFKNPELKDAVVKMGATISSSLSPR